MIDYIYTNEPIKRAAIAVTKIIREHLIKGERVLWLLSGGSGIAIAIEASRQLQNADLSNLFVSLTDERYGLVDHKDENWQQLLDANLNLPGANLYRPLIGQNIEETTIVFNNWLKAQFAMADYKIGIFGIGTDGHTAGIKPHSGAVTSPNFVTSFISDDFERITITFATIKQLDEAIIQASGSDKQLVVHSLVTGVASLDDQPAQILKIIPHVTLYTNNKEKK